MLDDDDTEDELTIDGWVTIWGPGIAARVELRSRISLLLLERVGGRLDLNIPVPSPFRCVILQSLPTISTWPASCATFMLTIATSGIFFKLLRGRLPFQVSRPPELGRYILGG